MAEYITKDAVISLFEKWSDGYAYIEIPVQDAIRQVCALTPADVRPVVLGVDYPMCCYECKTGLDDSGDYPMCRYTGETRGYTFNTRERRMDKCPLRPLSDRHGRLIDADVLESEMFELWKKNEISNSDWIGFREILKNQEAIIEKEGT